MTLVMYGDGGLGAGPGIGNGMYGIGGGGERRTGGRATPAVWTSATTGSTPIGRRN